MRSCQLTDPRSLGTAVSVFKTEAELVECFATALQSEKHSDHCVNAQVSAEFDYRSGRTDLLAINADGEVVSYEAKLKKWRTALHQAYRNTSFSDRSYVVLPMRVAQNAAAHSDEFCVRGVGICGVGPNGVEVLRPAPRLEPYRPWLHHQAIRHVRDSPMPDATR